MSVKSVSHVISMLFKVITVITSTYIKKNE